MISENAMTVLKARYLKKDNEGNVIETPDEMFMRVATALKPDDPEPFYNLMKDMRFLPNTPTLINAGKSDGQFSACFVLPIEDSMVGIFETVKNAALIHKTGGGTGFNFGHIRSKGSKVSTTNGIASGPISFMKVFDAATESVKQGGVRRGANMGMLPISHPDIEEFILCKDDTSKINNFNLSVAITDEFMDCVKNDKEFSLIEPSTGEAVRTVRAKELWNMIVHQAWKNGEPGIVFIDAINRDNPTPEYGDFEATNPCGEQPLLPYESCNLGSINLLEHLNDNLSINWIKLEKTVKLAVDFLNAVLDNNHFPLPQIKENTLRTRKIGLGVMGFADMLIKMHVPYSSKEGRDVAENVMSFISDIANYYSEEQGYNNATTTTIAPTGTISMIAGVSSGIEPNFSWVYTRNSCDKTLYVVHPLLEQELRSRELYNDNVLSELHKGTKISNIHGLEYIGNWWETSQEISPENHILMQAAFQKYVDNAVSKTINLPHDATEKDVSDAYMLAFTNGCKGVTVYRDGSRESQVLNLDNKKKEEPIKENTVYERPDKLSGTTEVKKIGCGKLYVTVNRDENGKPVEVFTNTGKAGGCPAQSEGLARMVSLALRYGVPPQAVTKQLCGIRCMSTVRKNGCNVLSCPDAIGRCIAADTKVKEEIPNAPVKNPCPSCGSELEQSEGCVICKNCGYSKCG